MWPNAVVSKVSAEGCRIRLDDIQDREHVIICIDKCDIQFGGRKPDFLVIVNKELKRVYCIELKRGARKAADIGDQLQSGADAIYGLGEPFASCEFVPVSAGTSFRSHEYKVFRRRARSIRFGRQARAILLRSNGDSL